MRESAESGHGYQRVVWLFQLRGETGSIIPIDAEVVRRTAKQVRIRVVDANGTVHERCVKPETLRRRKTM